MSGDSPTIPDDVPAAIADALDDCPPEQLRAVADYASALAAQRDGASVDSDDGEGSDDAVDEETATEREGVEQDDPEERPAEVPPNATVTIKEINDNRYYYWQWRDDDAIKSKYKSPVSPDE